MNLDSSMPQDAVPADQAVSTAVDDENRITLDTPIMRGNTVINEITLRRPQAGELRGLSLAELLQLDVTALCAVIPRISTPTIHKQEAMTLDPADLVQIGTKVAGFLLPKAAMAAASPNA